MLTYPLLDPVLFSIGPLQIRWYGLMYVIGFVAAYYLVAHQARIFHWRQMLQRLDNLNLALVLGIILGGRLGYVFFYNPGYYLQHPLEIAATWSGGMSFHGGCIGATLSGYLYCRRADLDFWKAADLFAVTAPIGLFFGRLGNFINGELFGRPAHVPWAMVFPDGGPLRRHPSQLYEAFLEGIVLFIILWTLKAKPWHAQSSRWPHGTMLALFFILYGSFRFLVEYFREPDSQLGLVLAGLSMGQVLCLLMVLAGGLLWKARKTALRKQNGIQQRRKGRT